MTALSPKIGRWSPVETWEGQPTGQASPVLLCVSDGGAHPPVIGEAWYDPESYGGTWWWANLSQGDYHASPIVEMQHGVPTYWMPMPKAPGEDGDPITIDMGVTGNAQLLLGYIAGALSVVEEPDYRLVSVASADGAQVVEHRRSGNTYQISVVQLEGAE